MNFHMFDKIINKIKKIRTEFNSNFFINVVSFPQAYKTSKGKNDVIFFFSFMHDGLGSLEWDIMLLEVWNWTSHLVHTLYFQYQLDFFLSSQHTTAL